MCRVHTCHAKVEGNHGSGIISQCVSFSLIVGGRVFSTYNIDVSWREAVRVASIACIYGMMLRA
eukprot:1138103-Pelagomonas_calceolata.AAC.11